MIQPGQPRVVLRSKMRTAVRKRVGFMWNSDDAVKNSVIDCGVTPTVDDRIVTLSTCVAEGKGYGTRWVVMAREAVR